MAGSLLDIYGLYNQALANYQRQVDAYNTAGNAWSQAVKDYNASIISDAGAYNQWNGNYSGGGPYTMYNGYTVGRTGTPISQYQTDPIGIGYKYYDAEAGNWQSSPDVQPVFQPDGSLPPNWESYVLYGSPTETTYIDPTTGLASVFAARPAASFDMVAPTAPVAPPPQEVSSILGNIDQTELYQSVFGKATPDILSSEAWGLQNVGTPFLSTETSAYETGNVNRMNNPMYYAQPELLTTGQSGQDLNSVISGQQSGNVYY